jgi:hypothetical protein
MEGVCVVIPGTGVFVIWVAGVSGWPQPEIRKSPMTSRSFRNSTSQRLGICRYSAVGGEYSTPRPEWVRVVDPIHLAGIVRAFEF